MIHAVIFDMDGLLLDSEVYWEEARSEFCAAHGCRWERAEELTVKGANSPEWAAKIIAHCGFGLAPREVILGVTERMEELYARRLPLLPGAVSTVRAVSARYPTSIASSSPPELIESAMRQAGLRSCFRAIVSADSIGRGKPAPDVFLAAAQQLGVPPSDIAVFEDSSAGITAGHAAGMYVIAVPNPHFPPTDEALALAGRVLPSLTDFDLAMLEQAGA